MGTTTPDPPPAGATYGSNDVVCQYTVSYTTGEAGLQETWLLDWILEWVADPSVHRIARPEMASDESQDSLTIIMRPDQCCSGTPPSHERLFDRLADRVKSLTVHCQSVGPSTDTVGIRPLEVSR